MVLTSVTLELMYNPSILLHTAQMCRLGGICRFIP